MRKTISLYTEGDYTFPMSGSFVPSITAYLHDDGQARPAILIIPGGGYRLVSPNEGQMIALRFFEEGYQAFVLTYSTNFMNAAPLLKLPLKDASRAMRCIRKNAGEFHVIPNRIAACGFSAGAHLAGSLAVHYDDVSLQTEPDADISCRPDAVVLNYPVITSGEKAHRDSFTALFGSEPTQEQLDWASLEKNVTPQTSPAFLWQTFTDETVPVENSMLFTRACREQGVPCELHLYMDGPHGMGLANADWAANNVGENAVYTMEQMWQSVKAAYAANPEAVPPFMAAAAQAESVEGFAECWNKAIAGFRGGAQPTPDACAAQWPCLAAAWLEKIWKR